MLLLDGFNGSVSSLAFSPDSQRLLVGTRAGTFRVWDGGVPVDAMPTQSTLIQSVNTIDFHANGNEFVVGGEMGWLGRRDHPNADYQLLQPTGKATSVTGLRYLSNDLLVVGTGSRTAPNPGLLVLWDFTKQRYREPQLRATQGVRAVDVLRDKRLVAWAEWGRKIAVWDIQKQQPVMFPISHDSRGVALHPSGEWLAATAEWGIKLFHLASRQERIQCVGHKGVVTCIAFSPDGQHLVTGSWDGTVRFWDWGTGKERTCFEWAIGKVNCLAFSPDGLQLGIGSDQGTVMLFDID